jgi:hypothetical protein
MVKTPEIVTVGELLVDPMGQNVPAGHMLCDPALHQYPAEHAVQASEEEAPDEGLWVPAGQG